MFILPAMKGNYTCGRTYVTMNEFDSLPEGWPTMA